MKEEKTEKQKNLTPRGAAQNFIRPYILHGDTMPLHPSVKLSHETENYSAHIEGENVAITKLYDVEIKAIYSVKEIMLDVSMEHAYGKGFTGITAATAKEGYEKRSEEIKVLLRQLNVKLKNHKKHLEENYQNWRYVTDLTHISNELKEFIALLK